MLKNWYAIYTQKVDDILDDFTKKFKNPQPMLTPLQENVSKIKPTYFTGFNNQSNTFLTINCQYKTIGILIEKLKEVTMYLDLEKQIWSAWCTEPIALQNVPEFFLSKNGFYIEEEESIAEFKRLVNLYANFICKHDKNDTGDGPHNVRVLSNFTNCLEATTSSLLKLQGS